MNNYLLVTLGHNSSAIFVDNSVEDAKKPYVIGYEQERLSRIKADSQFPYDAIKEIEYNIGRDSMKDCTILVSHWFDLVDYAIPNKYITLADLSVLKSYSTDIRFVNGKFTHHDAHAYSAYTFYDYFKKQTGNIPLYCIVADGFGNDQEVLSIYRRDKGQKPELLNRVKGFEYSLGLFYQYATSFVGMKENQDEYKFLGYESKVDSTFNESQIAYLSQESDYIVEFFKSSLLNHTIDCTHKSSYCIDFEKLNEVKQKWYKSFKSILLEPTIYITDTHSDAARIAIAFLIQRTVEKLICCVCKSYGIENVCLAGGLFYNVKLNNTILNCVTGDISIMPLAGDQGAAIGMYAAQDNVPQFPFDTLAIGPRRLYNIEKYVDKENVFMIPSEWSNNPLDGDECYKIKALADIIAKHIANNEIVDLIYGNMEFGPRALCNTSSLFLPSKELVKQNNTNNKRNEVMPCAPVCTAFNAEELFYAEELNRVIGSDKFMICTFNYKKRFSEVYGGAMHKKTLYKNTYTGRPQVVGNKSFMHEVLESVQCYTDSKCLVNTSFNVHGNPIVFDTADILQNYKFQCENAKKNNTKEPVLIIVK